LTTSTEVRYTYRTYVRGNFGLAMHHTDDLAEAEALTEDGVIWRKPDGDWARIED
jgi:hypothetical protein